MEKLLSIIIPSYNVERYIRKNLESLLANNDIQDYIEIIVVNDGSQDNTKCIVENVIENNNSASIVLINKMNGGYGSTINEGLKVATGRYIRLLDGDDWVNPEGLMKLVEYIKSGYNTDVIYCDYCVFNEVDNSIKTVKVSNLISRTKFVIDQIPLHIVPMHGQVFKRSILIDNHISIDENCFYTDTEYIILPIPYINSVSYLDCGIYVYRVGREGQSVSAKGWNKNEKNHEIVLTKIVKTYDELNTDIPFYTYKKELISTSIINELDKRIYGYPLMYKDKVKDYRSRLLEKESTIFNNFPELKRYSKNNIPGYLRKLKYNPVLFSLYYAIFKTYKKVKGRY